MKKTDPEIGLFFVFVLKTENQSMFRAPFNSEVPSCFNLSPTDSTVLRSELTAMKSNVNVTALVKVEFSS